MTSLKVSVVVCFFVFGVGNSIRLPHPCSIYLARRLDVEQPSAEYVATCSSGRIIWNYPVNRIRNTVNFPGTVCIRRQGFGAEHVTVYKDQDDSETEVTFDADGRACVASGNGNRVTLILEGLERRTNMVQFTYEVPNYNPSFREVMRSFFLNYFTT